MAASMGTGADLPCNYCRSTDTFKKQADLLNHIVYEHPYRCAHCPQKMVKLARSVQKHYRNYHPKLHPYFCKVCTAVFDSGLHLEEHSSTAHLDNPPTSNGVEGCVTPRRFPEGQNSSSLEESPTSMSEAQVRTTTFSHSIQVLKSDQGEVKLKINDHDTQIIDQGKLSPNCCQVEYTLLHQQRIGD